MELHGDNGDLVVLALKLLGRLADAATATAVAKILVPPVTTRFSLRLTLNRSRQAQLPGSSESPLPSNPPKTNPPLTSNLPNIIVKLYQEFVFTQEKTEFVFTGQERFCVYFKECPLSGLRFLTLVRAHTYTYRSVGSGPWRLSHCLCTDCIAGQCP